MLDRDGRLLRAYATAEGRWRLPARIDAVMGAEALVLIGKQHVEQPRIDVGDPRRQPPAALGRGIGAQQPAVAIEDAGGELQVLPSGGGPREVIQ